MNVIWGIVIVILSLLAWGGQTPAWFAPSTAVRWQLMEAEGDVEPTFWADIRAEAFWDAMTLWVMVAAGVLLIVDAAAWPYLGLVGAGMYLYFGGRGISARVSRLDTRPPGRSGWNVWRAVIGVAYLAAAGFNAVYTLPRADQLDGYADGAWFGFLSDFMRDVFMPNGTVFMTAVIIFEVGVGALVLHRDRYVDIGVAASVLWVLAVLPFLAWPYLITNLVLVPIQGILLLRRYEHPLWRRVREEA